MVSEAAIAIRLAKGQLCCRFCEAVFSHSLNGRLGACRANSGCTSRTHPSGSCAIGILVGVERRWPPLALCREVGGN